MISVKEIQKAAAALEGMISRTPLIHSSTFSRVSGAQVYLKLENLQETGSFKIRGATWKILGGADRFRRGGVVAASAGNHAQGVALAATRAKLKSTIVMPEWSSISKQEAARSYGGEVILHGQTITESIRKARELALDGRTFIHPYDDVEIITGQGTIALEILEDLPDVDMIIVPVGGGGLVSGIASAVKAVRPQVAVVGVQTDACPSAYQARLNGRITRVDVKQSIADGIAVKELGGITFPIIEEKVDDLVLVEEEWIAAGIVKLLERKRVLAEGAGAVPLAALLGGRVTVPAGAKVVLVVSGGNVDSPLLDRVIRKGLFRNGRMVRFSVCLDDVPGSLARLLGIIARLRANVVHIDHNRSGWDLPVVLSIVERELETRSESHIAEIIDTLRNSGYAVHSDLPNHCFLPPEIRMRNPGSHEFHEKPAAP